MLFIYSKVCKLSAKPEFIENAKAGNVLARKCTKCGEIHLATVYFCKKCGSKGFEDSIIEGKGKIVTYTIMTVPPEGFEEFAPYAWVVMELDNALGVRISGFCLISPNQMSFQLVLMQKSLDLTSVEYY